jgi:hypothetical protein
MDGGHLSLRRSGDDLSEKVTQTGFGAQSSQLVVVATKSSLSGMWWRAMAVIRASIAANVSPIPRLM